MLKEESTAAKSGTKMVEQPFWSSQDCESSQETWESKQTARGLLCPWCGSLVWESEDDKDTPESTAGRLAPGQEQKGVQGELAES